eukprot:6459984-Pyramimonas_sp.AAC.2
MLAALSTPVFSAVGRAPYRVPFTSLKLAVWRHGAAFVLLCVFSVTDDGCARVRPEHRRYAKEVNTTPYYV